jgi:hypothetical protein
MAIPSSQHAAVWVKSELVSTNWTALDELMFSTLRKFWPTPSEEELWDYVELNISFVAEHLRDCIAEWNVDGATHHFEIDNNDPSPYLRLLAPARSEVITKLRKVDPFAFEGVCANVLGALGGVARTTRRTNGGGIDFVGLDLSGVPSIVSVPAACRTVVIGHAKRYKDGSAITETQLREFVGAAVLKKHQLAKDGSITPLAPVILRFGQPQTLIKTPSGSRATSASDTWPAS